MMGDRANLHFLAIFERIFALEYLEIRVYTALCDS